MKRTGNTDIFTLTLPPYDPSKEAASTINNQNSNTSRALNAIQGYDTLLLRKIEDATQSFFGRCADSICDLVPEIFFKCTLQDVRNLRLVSIGCYYLFSTINSFFKNDALLSKKASIPFSYDHLYPITETSRKEKFAFAKKHTQIVLTISIPDLVNALHNKTSILYNIPSKSLKITLNIFSIEEIIQLQTLLSSLFNQDNTTFINSIVSMDFTRIDITADTMNLFNELLMTISLGIKLLSNLTKLSFGNIITYEEDEKETTLTLPNPLEILQSFSCGNIDHDAIVNLPEKLPFLTSFSCGYIATNAQLKLPKRLNNLTSFSCGNVYDDFTLPNKLNNLISFTCDHVWTNTTLTLPEKLNCLKYFRCKTIYTNATLALPKKPHNLKSFSCRRIWGTLKFPEEVNYLPSIAAENTI